MNAKKQTDSKTKRTVEILIEHDADLTATLSAFQKVCNHLSPICWNNGKPKSRRALHDAAYHKVKGIVSAQMTQTAIRFVSACYSKKKRRKISQPVHFKRPFALFLVGERGRDACFCPDGTLSIWTVSGRKRLAYYAPPYSRTLLRSALRIDSIRVKERKGKLVGFVTITLAKPKAEGLHFVGVDLNETNHIVGVKETGEVFFVSGLNYRIWMTKHRKLRARLQRKLAERKGQRRGTRSLRRRLQHLLLRQRNFTRTYCHTVAKGLVEWAGKDAILVLERLQNLRKKTSNTALNRRLHLFPYAKLRNYIVQKAEMKGMAVLFVDPSFTSQTCHACGSRGERQRHRFYCPACSTVYHADLNAAINILRRADETLRLRLEGGVVGRPSVVPLQRLAVLPEGSAVGGMQALHPLGDSGSPNRSFHGCGQGLQ